MNEVIECRSDQQANEDAMFSELEWCQQMLNTMSCGRCLYIGEQRKRMVVLRDELTHAIEDGVTLDRNVLARRILSIIRMNMPR